MSALGYISDSTSAKRTEYEGLYDYYYGAWKSYIDEARLDLEMHLGAHFTAEQLEQARRTGRRLYPFNKTARQVDLISGYEIRNRHILKIEAQEDTYAAAARQHTTLIMQQMARGGYQTLSEAFKWGSLVTGSNLVEVYVDRYGQMGFARRPYNSFLLDPELTKLDLSDCSNILTGQWLNADKIKQLLPTEAEKIDSIPPHGARRWISDMQYPRRDEIRLYEERWRKRTEDRKVVMFTGTGQTVPWRSFYRHPAVGGAENAYRLMNRLRWPDGSPVFIKLLKAETRVDLQIFVDGYLVWEGPNPTGLDDYNAVWLAGEFAPEMNRDELRLRSLTRRLREPQHARDKRLNQAIDIIETSLNSGKIVRENTLVNPEDAFKSGQGQVLFVRNDFSGSLEDAVQSLKGPGLPAGVLELITILDKEETETTGLNQEIFGSDDNQRDIPGILAKFRTGQALTAQQSLFQTYREAKRQLGLKIIRLNQMYIDPVSLMRRIKEPPAKGFYEPALAKYDCVPVEGLLTDSQKALHFAEMKALYAMFPNLVPASLVLEAAPIQQPEKLLQAVRQREQMQEFLLKAQLESKQAMDAVLQAQAVEDLAQARQRRGQAMLDETRTLVEIQKIGSEPRLGLLDRYIKALEIINKNIQAMQEQRNAVVGQGRQPAHQAG